MKSKMFSILIAILALTFVGCEDDDNILVLNDLRPQAPQGVTSVTGDESVIILWNGLYEDDIVEYVIGWNDELLGEYEMIGTVSALPRPSDNTYSFEDTDVDNGTTYFYAVWAIDAGGQRSEPSFEEVFDTPRPEGDVDLYSLYEQPTLAGFDLFEGQRVPWDANTADVFIDTATLIVNSQPFAVFFINAANLETDIQDMGYTDSFDNITWAPDTGWSDLRYYELVPGHTYVIWTSDLHYAKMRVKYISRATGMVGFEWAYQLSLDPHGNRELAPPPPVARETSDQSLNGHTR